MTRRDLLRSLLATAAASTVDFEHLLWTPKPIITVPAQFSLGPTGCWSQALKEVYDHELLSRLLHRLAFPVFIVNGPDSRTIEPRTIISIQSPPRLHPVLDLSQGK